MRLEQYLSALRICPRPRSVAHLCGKRLCWHYSFTPPPGWAASIPKRRRPIQPQHVLPPSGKLKQMPCMVQPRVQRQTPPAEPLTGSTELSYYQKAYTREHIVQILRYEVFQSCWPWAVHDRVLFSCRPPPPLCIPQLPDVTGGFPGCTSAG
ncbi:hypothetical protein JZ751_012734 [Albula glossodonta]|uniref:Uncharacterized protein n=1 Tax=Albula glossodonta TaxID=121402 RepID=A0A8T2MZP8_9TELE|nr:hypothetical protein JZ751_012734 [Albula glossodonta]